MSKVRYGFVSNSSSSSFIIGIGEVKDEEKFFAFLEKNKIDHHGCDFQVKRGCEWKESGRFESYGGNNSSVHKNVSTLKDDKFYFKVGVGNNEGDSAFYVDDEDYELNYKIADYDWFDNLDQSKYIDLLNADFVESFEDYYGAERNG